MLSDKEMGRMEQLMGEYALHCRRRAVKSLLVGNDTQCFTTQQYIERYVKQCHKEDNQYRKGFVELVTDVAEMHLRSVGMVEVKPGVWARKE